MGAIRPSMIFFLTTRIKEIWFMTAGITSGNMYFYIICHSLKEQVV